MDVEVMTRPVFVVALSEGEVKAALDDPAALQAALRRRLLDERGIAPLQLADGHAKAKPKKKRKVKKLDALMYQCPQCEEQRSTAGMLARHVRSKHPEASAPAAEEVAAEVVSND